MAKKDFIRLKISFNLVEKYIQIWMLNIIIVLQLIVVLIL